MITEYVDVAHAFYDKRESGFVNGLLDAIAKEARARGPEVREREVIERLRRIATAPEAADCSTTWRCSDGLVITHDSIAEGVHFLPHDPPASVGWKLVAVNLSDLAGKGATPVGALLSLTMPGRANGSSVPGRDRGGLRKLRPAAAWRRHHRDSPGRAAGARHDRDRGRRRPGPRPRGM